MRATSRQLLTKLLESLRGLIFSESLRDLKPALFAYSCAQKNHLQTSHIKSRIEFKKKKKKPQLFLRV